MDDKNKLLKDKLFNKKNVKYLSKLIKNSYPEFDNDDFVKEVLLKFPELELKERIYWIRKNIEIYIEKDYKETINILLLSLQNNSTHDSDSEEVAREDFVFSAYSNYVAVNGCDEENIKLSLNALGEFTRFFSAEFAIRFFINKFPNMTFYKMIKWSQSSNLHQRRLSSEGLRPKLPWAKGIEFDYKKGSETLDNLYFDNSRYVTRSVANHLNDISKIDHVFVLDKLSKWAKSHKQNKLEMDYIIRHSLRTSIKKGHKETLEFLGYSPEPNVIAENIKIENKDISIGEALEFSFNVVASKNEKLIVDYRITYATPHKRISQKVFKIKKLDIKENHGLNPYRHAFNRPIFVC